MVVFRVLRFALFLTLLPLVALLNTQEDFQLASRAIKEYLRTRNAPDYYHTALQNYQLKHLFREGMAKVYDASQVCYLCNEVVDLVILERRVGASRETLVDEAELLCIDLGIESERVCKGAIELNIDPLLYIMDNYPNLTSNRVCGSVLQSLNCPIGDAFEWSIDIASGNSPDRTKTSDAPSLRILHLSDIHYDPNYTPNGNANCGEPICCQADQDAPTSDGDACGYWTDYRDADVPWHLIEETVRQVNTQDFDYVYYTGDIISHRVWDTSLTNNTNTITQLYAYFLNRFDVPVYPIFGNHEPHPLNLWATESVTDPQFSLTWLYQLAAEFWSELVGEDISETVLKGGYYTVSPRPGFRIIAINSNLCYTVNWWLIFKDVDPFGQLQWLADTLKQAEDNDESVHILSHIPTGTAESLSVWGREYSRILNRFANTITGQFNGHTHKDEFHVYYNRSNPSQPVGVAFNGASVTPYSDSNPSYKIYELDGNTFTLKDYEEWTFNLTLANSQGSDPPEWYKLYSFIDAYGVESLDPVEVDKAVQKMATDHNLLDDYFKFYYRNSDARGDCDESCQRDYICQIATTVHGEDTQCNRFLSLYNGET